MYYATEMDFVGMGLAKVLAILHSCCTHHMPLAVAAEDDDLVSLVVSFAHPNIPVLIDHVQMLPHQLVLKYLLREAD